MTRSLTGRARMIRVLSPRRSAAVVLAGALVLAGAHPAGAGPRADGTMSWRLGPSGMGESLPEDLSEVLPPFTVVPLLDGDGGRVEQDTTVTTFAPACFKLFGLVWTARGNATAHWVHTRWTGDASSLDMQPARPVRRVFAYEVFASDESFCRARRDAALAAAQAQAVAATEGFASMSGPASARGAGPPGTSWQTVGTASFDAADGSLSYSGDADLCTEQECTTLPATISGQGGVASPGDAQ